MELWLLVCCPGEEALTDEVVGASQVVVPHRHLQRLVAQLRQRDLVEELLQATHVYRMTTDTK